MVVNVAKEYSDAPGGRYITDGSHSGEDFRDNFLESRYLECLFLQERLTLILDGGYGYPPGFLEEAFGGMVRKGYSFQELSSVIELIYTEEPEIIDDIMEYMREAEEIMRRDNS